MIRLHHTFHIYFSLLDLLDPNFFSFYRAMQAYSKALTEGDTTMVLSPNGEFFEYFTDAEGEDQ